MPLVDVAEDIVNRILDLARRPSIQSVGQLCFGPGDIALLVESHSEVIGAGWVVGKGPNQLVEDLESIVVFVALQINIAQRIQKSGIVGFFANCLSCKLQRLVQTISSLGEQKRKIVHGVGSIRPLQKRAAGYSLRLFLPICHFQNER